MNSMSDKEIEDIIDRVFADISEESLYEKCERPILEAIRSFSYETSEEFSVDSFHDALAAFIIHIHRTALKPRRTVRKKDALDKAINILEHHYQGIDANGYSGALFDASNLHPRGTGTVLESIAQAVVDLNRRKTIERVLTENLGLLPHQTRAKVVELLLRRYERFLGTAIKQARPETLASDCESLLLSLMAQ